MLQGIHEENGGHGRRFHKKADEINTSPVPDQEASSSCGLPWQLLAVLDCLPDYLTVIAADSASFLLLQRPAHGYHIAQFHTMHEEVSATSYPKISDLLEFVRHLADVT